jgi:hypothetical protein
MKNQVRIKSWNRGTSKLCSLCLTFNTKLDYCLAKESTKTKRPHNYNTNIGIVTEVWHLKTIDFFSVHILGERLASILSRTAPNRCHFSIMRFIVETSLLDRLAKLKKMN